MEAVVCKGGKGICTWRQAVVGRRARSFHLEVACNKKQGSWEMQLAAEWAGKAEQAGWGPALGQAQG